MKRFLKSVKVASAALVAAVTVIGFVACTPSTDSAVPAELEVPVASAKADAVKPADLPASNATKFVSSDEDLQIIKESLSAVIGGISGGEELPPEAFSKIFRDFNPSEGLPDSFPLPPESESEIELVDEETSNFVEKIMEFGNLLNELGTFDEEEKFTADIKFNEEFGTVDLAALIASADPAGKLAPVANLLDLKLDDSNLKFVINADIDKKTKSGKIISEGKAKGNIALKIKSDDFAEEGMILPVSAAALNFDSEEYAGLIAVDGKFRGNASAAASVNFGTSFALPVDENTALGGKIVLSTNVFVKSDAKLLEKLNALSESEKSEDFTAVTEDLSNYLTELINVDVTLSVYDDNNKSTYSKKLTKDQLIELFGSFVNSGSEE